MSDSSGDEPRSGEFVQSLDRGLAVIRAFGAERPELSLSDVAREAGLSRSATRRFLHTLVELGYIGTDGRVFFLRPRLLELGFAYLSSMSLGQIVQPHLRLLSEETGESSSVAILDGTDIVYVARVAVSRIMSVAIGVGTRLPAFATSMGRAILGSGSADQRAAFLEKVDITPLTPLTVVDAAALGAELDRARQQGWALVDQELELGLRSLAAPVRDASGAVIAAVNVAAPSRAGQDDRALFVAPLLRAAQGIEQDLAHARPARL